MGVSVATVDFSQDTYKTNLDKELNKRIRREVGSQGFWKKHERVILHTEDATVILEGEVSNMDERERVIKEIQKVDGVKTVKSNMKLQKPAKRNIIIFEEKGEK